MSDDVDDVDDAAGLAEQVARQREVIAQLEEERSRLQELLLELPKLFASTDAAELVSSIAEAARSLTGGSFALFAPSDGGAMTLVGLDESEFSAVPSPGFAPLLGGPHGQGARLIPDVTRWAGESAAGLYGVLADGRLIRSWLLAPVRGGDERLRGVLYLGQPRPHHFTAQHETQLVVLAARLGLALDAAELHEERGRVLAALETSLLPPLLPVIPGLDLAARYRAADVTGVARYTIRALAPELVPSATLERLNTTLVGQRPASRFVSALLADVVAGEALSVVLANAGHPAPVLLRDDGTAVELDVAHGTVLGVVPAIGAVDVPVALEPGDALVLYTDGVTEARNQEGEQFGTDRLLALASTCAGRSAAGVARRIELGVMAHVAGTTDDIAIVVLRRQPH